MSWSPEGALPWPVEGLYRLSELPEPPPSPVETRASRNGKAR